MIVLTFFQRGTPDIVNLILFLIGVLLCLLAVNSLIDWLKSKPWHKNKLPSDNITDENTTPPFDQSAENDLHNQSDLFTRKILETTSKM